MSTVRQPQYTRRPYATQDGEGAAPGAESAQAGTARAAPTTSGAGRVIGNRTGTSAIGATRQVGTGTAASGSGASGASSAAPTAGARLAQLERTRAAMAAQAKTGTAPSTGVTSPNAGTGNSAALASRRAYVPSTGTGAPATQDPTAIRAARTAAAAAANDSALGTRRGTGAPPVEGGTVPTPRDEMSFKRRPSQLVLQREMKTDYWQEVATEVQKQNGNKLSPEDLNSVISRAMSLGIVGDRKQRESLSGPKATELFEKLQQTMQQKVTELSGGKVTNVDQLLTQNSSLMDKIMTLEKTLSVLESKKSHEEEEEKKRVQNKIGELERSLKALEEQKKEQREQNRRTMKLEIANLKEMMAKVQRDQQTETAGGEAKNLSSKMNRLEAALRLMNEERKKDKVEDKETLLLRKKLTLFEQKLKEMEEEKKLKEEAEQGNQLRDKLLLMEDKLAKMERRKSMSMANVMQQKMEAVEKQLAMLRNQKDGGQVDERNNQIAQKMSLLEKQLKEMASQKITPGMVNDEETVALRQYIQKLEGSIMGAEKRMDDQRKKIEEERRLNHEKRMREEEEFRRQARQKEEELLKRIAQMEQRINKGGGGGPMDPAILDRLKALESSGGSGSGGGEVNNKILEMEKRLQETQKMLEEERKMTRTFLEGGPKQDTAQLESWQKDAQIAWLKQANEDLFAKIQATNDLIDKRMDEMKNFKFSAPPGGVVHKSGLSYEDINKKLAEIQAKLFDPNTDEREGEQLNIEYEKLISELEQTPEYQKEQEELKNKWKNENAPINKSAFERVVAELQAMGDQKLTAYLGRKGELRLLLRTPDQIMKQHINDFKQLSTQNLTEDEARALYHNMPAFKKEQDKQVEWVQQLQAKIELEMSKPKTKPPPPIPKKKAVVIKKAAAGGGGGGGGGFLDELLAKRKKRD